MTLRLTPQVLSGAYTYLRATQPFSRWNLPAAEGVRFRVTKAKDYCGQCEVIDPGVEYRICISSEHYGYHPGLLITMAHEMVHLSIFRTGRRDSSHGASFKKRAARVCRIHGFDPKDF